MARRKERRKTKNRIKKKYIFTTTEGNPILPVRHRIIQGRI